MSSPACLKKTSLLHPELELFISNGWGGVGNRQVCGTKTFSSITKDGITGSEKDPGSVVASLRYYTSLHPRLSDLLLYEAKQLLIQSQQEGQMCINQLTNYSSCTAFHSVPDALPWICWISATGLALTIQSSCPLLWPKNCTVLVGAAHPQVPSTAPDTKEFIYTCLLYMEREK